MKKSLRLFVSSYTEIVKKVFTRYCKIGNFVQNEDRQKRKLGSLCFKEKIALKQIKNMSRQIYLHNAFACNE